MNRNALLDSLLNDVPLFGMAIDLYRWFVVNYTWMMAVRAAAEAFEQVAILQTPWYNIASAIIEELSKGFLVQIAIAAAATEVTNMVIGAYMKHKARRQGRNEALAENNKAWLEWLRRKEEAEARGESFDQPNPASDLASSA